MTTGVRPPAASDAWDPLHNESPDHLFWTTTNAGEAVPGVQTPLSLTVWQRTAGLALARAAKAMGVLAEDEDPVAPPFYAFYGRAVMSVDFLRDIGDRMPGATGQQVVSGLLGFVPDGMAFAPTRRYTLKVLRRFPATFRRVPRMLEQLVREQNAWWQESAFAVADLDEAGVHVFLIDAFDQHERATTAQCVAVFNGVQPVHDALERVIEKYGGEDSSVLTAPVGGAEMEVVADIWRASRGELTIADVVRAHGFHGPFEGEISSRVWRDDDAPLHNLIDRYAQRPDSDSPLAQDAQRAEARQAAERALIAGAPLAARPAVRAVLALARKRLHLRGVAKRSMLQGFDAIRAGARRLGEVAAADGRLDDPEDIFYLTADELVQPLLPDVKELIAKRRARREEYRPLALPTNFSGTPTPIPAASTDGNSDRRTIEGIGVSAGTVEGVARIVTDPSFAEVEPDEVLVAPTTDPSWSSIMFISSALVVDIGGALSHAAVVARELGIPCVVNTRDGTTAIHTGDRVRVDGRAGTVEILEKRKEAS
jgi:phosphohistidine swiveling domain-containing protein